MLTQRLLLRMQPTLLQPQHTSALMPPPGVMTCQGYLLALQHLQPEQLQISMLKPSLQPGSFSSQKQAAQMWRLDPACRFARPSLPPGMHRPSQQHSLLS